MKNLNIILIIVAMAVIGAVAYYFGYDQGWERSIGAVNTGNNNQNSQNSENQNMGQAQDTFHKDDKGNYLGTITLTGYVDVQRRVCNPGDMCGETVDYASFIFTTNNEAIKQFTGTMDGNSFIAGDRVGIGCQQKDKNRIYYENDADSGYKTGEISGNDYTKLMASSKNNPVQIQMTRELYTSGRGAPDCYSHFRNFNVL